MTNKKLLLVEDSPTQSFRLKIMLEEFDFDVIQAGSGKEAFDLALKEKPDVILSDILMPEMDGFELCHAIQNNHEIRNIPVILQSANYQSTEDRDFGLDIGADAFIPKGFSGKELAKIIQHVINRNKKYKKSDDIHEKNTDEPFDILHAHRMLYRLLEDTALLEQANSAIKAERNRAQQLLDVASVMMVAFDPQGIVTMVNPKGCKILGYDQMEIIGKDWFGKFVADIHRSDFKSHYMEMLKSQTDYDDYCEYMICNQRKEERLIAWHSTIITNEAGQATGILNSGEDITEKKNAEQKILESEKKYRSLFNNIPDGVFRVDADGRFQAANPALIRLLGYETEEELRKVDLFNLLNSTEQKDLCIDLFQKGSDISELELALKIKTGEVIYLLVNARFNKDAEGDFLYYEGTLTDITKIKQVESELAALYQQEQKRVMHLSTLQKISNKLVGMHNQKDVMQVAAEQGRIFADQSVCAILKITDGRKKQSNVIAESGLSKELPPAEDFPAWTPVFDEIIEKNKPVFVSREKLKVPKPLQIYLDRDIQSINAYPISINGQVDSIMVFGRKSENPPPEWEIALIELLTERVANALENARLFEEINQSLQRLASLRSIDQAISSNQNLDVTLDILIDQVINQLKVDAACILVYDKNREVVIYKRGKGFTGEYSSGKEFELHTTFAEQAIKGKHTTYLTDKEMGAFIHLKDGKFRNAAGTPIIVKGEIKGVLEVFNIKQINASVDWIEFLETLGRQAAIALDNYDLFTNLQKMNEELSEAYDATIQGWSGAMDLRDKETEGHTQRVTEITISLAIKMGYCPDELIHLRRGALLHDIGKMGIPDRILLKEGPLTDEEWVIMRKHPEFANELISPIKYLWPALDIPYCHHEKWDGSGYPRGLKGEEIPLAARVFCIVDVWDALTSDRPYRKAWPVEKVIEHIREQKGKHFDPRVVDVFLEHFANDGR